MQISLTHTIQGVCCADMTCLWCLRTVMFSFCGYFLLISCFLWGQRVGKHLICTHSVSLHHNHSLGSNLLLECMQVYLFQKLCSCHIPPRMQTGMLFTHVHALPLVAAVCVTLLCQSLPHPEPIWKHFECPEIQNTHLNWQEWKHGIPVKRKKAGHYVFKDCSRES